MPNQLKEHCQSTNTPGPGCLCPLKNSDQASYLESSFAPVNLPGYHNGEHAAQCSVLSCGYFGMISSCPVLQVLMYDAVPLQRIYLQKASDFYAKRKTTILKSCSLN